MSNKVRFGLKKVHYALIKADGTYDEVKPFAGAVKLTLTKEGGDSRDFNADDGVFYTFAGTNSGYSADLEMAYIPASVRADLLGEAADETDGGTVEYSDVQPSDFALIFEANGDKGPEGYVFYNCKASRPDMNANTETDSSDVDTDTLKIRMISKEFEVTEGESTVKRPAVRRYVESDKVNDPAKYASFFKKVYKPGEALAVVA